MILVKNLYPQIESAFARLERMKFVRKYGEVSRKMDLSEFELAASSSNHLVLGPPK